MTLLKKAFGNTSLSTYCSKLTHSMTRTLRKTDIMCRKLKRKIDRCRKARANAYYEAHAEQMRLKRQESERNMDALFWTIFFMLTLSAQNHRTSSFNFAPTPA